MGYKVGRAFDMDMASPTRSCAQGSNRDQSDSPRTRRSRRHRLQEPLQRVRHLPDRGLR